MLILLLINPSILISVICLYHSSSASFSFTTPHLNLNIRQTNLEIVVLCFVLCFNLNILSFIVLLHYFPYYLPTPFTSTFFLYHLPLLFDLQSCLRPIFLMKCFCTSIFHSFKWKHCLPLSSPSISLSLPMLFPITRKHINNVLCDSTMLFALDWVDVVGWL